MFSLYITGFDKIDTKSMVDVCSISRGSVCCTGNVNRCESDPILTALKRFKKIETQGWFPVLKM
jgi:hypothetical protein